MNYNDLIAKRETNYAKIVGVISTEPEKSHEIEGEKFFEFIVDVERLSKIKDSIPVTISERLLQNSSLKKGDVVEIEGEYRSYNKLINEKSRLILTLFAKSFTTLEEHNEDVNEIKLTGFICKQPVYRTTPFDREICDILLAVNRANYHKSDYIPCIMWGRNARFVSNQPVGCKIELTGRIQSRPYTKVMPDGSISDNVAYEVSCQTVAVLSNVANIKAESDQNKDVSNSFYDENGNQKIS